MRESALQPLHQARNPQWTVVNGMRVPQSFGRESGQTPILLADLSCLLRTGLKGPGAAEWLISRNIPVPPQANGWLALPGGGVIARLGETEFFLEDGSAGTATTIVERELGSGAAGVYPVLRRDAALALWGVRANEVLLETCSVDFSSIDSARRDLVMSTMVGVSVLVIARSVAGVPVFRIWVDPTFGPYLWRTLVAIVEELGGALAGLAWCGSSHAP